MADRGPSVDHAMNHRCRPNSGTLIGQCESISRVAGLRQETCLFRFVDSAGVTPDFLLSAWLGTCAAKEFLDRALRSPGPPKPRVIKADGNPLYPIAIKRAVPERGEASEPSTQRGESFRELPARDK